MAVNMPNAPIAKKRKDIRGLPQLPRLVARAWYQ
jgi:hypothetical protein